MNYVRVCILRRWVIERKCGSAVSNDRWTRGQIGWLERACASSPAKPPPRVTAAWRPDQSATLPAPSRVDEGRQASELKRDRAAPASLGDLPTSCLLHACATPPFGCSPPHPSRCPDLSRGFSSPIPQSSTWRRASFNFSYLIDLWIHRSPLPWNILAKIWDRWEDEVWKYVREDAPPMFVCLCVYSSWSSYHRGRGGKKKITSAEWWLLRIRVNERM